VRGLFDTVDVSTLPAEPYAVYGTADCVSDVRTHLYEVGELLMIWVKVLIVLLALFAPFTGLLITMLYLNDWGQTAPSEVAQIFWALSLVIWYGLLSLPQLRCIS